MEFEDKYIVVDGRRIRYVDVGEGPVVVMLHGLGYDAAAEQWYELIERLLPDYRCVAFDMFGWGLSDRPADGYTFSAWTNTVVGLLRELGIQRATLAGHTLGGWIMGLVAHDHPHLVEKLILASPASLNSTAPRSVAGFSIPDRDGVRERMLYHYVRPELVTEEFVDKVYNRMLKPGVYESYVAILTYINDPEVRSGWGLTNYLAGIEMPTLVTWEKDNKAISWEHSHVVMSLLPHGKLFLMDDAAYFSMARRPEEYASAVKEFLAL